MPTERACGTRSCGAYIEIPMGEDGMPLEWFILDPPIPPETMGLSNDPAREFANKKGVLYQDNNGIYHVIDWVGSDYPYVSDFIEEGRKMGFSRKLPPNFPFEKLTCGQSTMLCIHPRAYNDLWGEQRMAMCKSLHEALKHPGNPFWKEIADRVVGHETWSGDIQEDAMMLYPQDGPCTWKAYGLVPESAGTSVENSQFYQRKLGKTEFGTTYFYAPTGEDPSGLRSGFFARLPIPIMTFVDGSMQEKERKQWEKNRDKAVEAGFTVKSIHMEYDPEAGINVEVLDEIVEM